MMMVVRSVPARLGALCTYSATSCGTTATAARSDNSRSTSRTPRSGSAARTRRAPVEREEVHDDQRVELAPPCASRQRHACSRR
jgi:hypothetical protein